MHKRTGYEQYVTPSHIYSTTTHFFNGAGGRINLRLEIRPSHVIHTVNIQQSPEIEHSTEAHIGLHATTLIKKRD